ncbi:hypothetical protein HanPI659440_Chr08g0289301 [Helianthus annuus]|nr:hypothetical protein HanPI659440_Chr08g0289301 [Helianthus annuus]
MPRQPLSPDLNACSHDQGYGSPYYEPGYAPSYGHEEYGNNVFVSGASGVQEDVGQPSCVQESLGDDPPVQESLGDEPPVQESLGDETPAYPEVSYKTDQVLYVIGWELRALIGNLASSRLLKSVEQCLSFCFKIRLWIHITIRLYIDVTFESVRNIFTLRLPLCIEL